MTFQTPEEVAKEILKKIYNLEKLDGVDDREIEIIIQALRIQAEKYEARIKELDNKNESLKKLVDSLSEVCINRDRDIRVLEALLEEARDVARSLVGTHWDKPTCNDSCDVVTNARNFLQKLNSMKEKK